MKNTITAKIPFYFKGELHEPASTLDLDDWAKRGQGELPNFPITIAKENQIGSYSYELEVMEMSEVLFENPTGSAVEFYDQNTATFDFEGFKRHWIAQQSLSTLSQIASKHLGTSLQPGSALHHALMAAYIAGKEE